MASRDLDVGELDVAVVDPVAAHLLADVSDVDAGQQLECSEKH
jgi:hypothetical protein